MCLGEVSVSLEIIWLCTKRTGRKIFKIGIDMARRNKNVIYLIVGYIVMNGFLLIISGGEINYA